MLRSKTAFLVFCLAAGGTLPSCRQDVATVIGTEITSLEGLHAPWDGIEDSTIVSFHADADALYFKFEVIDSTIVLSDHYGGEDDVNNEDRVELFISPSDSLRTYFCAEIDPLGRVMDYSCRYYRNFDFSWTWDGLSAEGRVEGNGYTVEGMISLNGIRKMGIDPEKPFWMGIFRADFHECRPENWLARFHPEVERPDFHRPGYLAKFKIDL